MDDSCPAALCGAPSAHLEFWSSEVSGIMPGAAGEDCLGTTRRLQRRLWPGRLPSLSGHRPGRAAAASWGQGHPASWRPGGQVTSVALPPHVVPFFMSNGSYQIFSPGVMADV
jgi:hypothetical protein